MQKWRESAEDFGLIEKLADAHYYTGEHFLNQVKINWKKICSIALLMNIVTMILQKDTYSRNIYTNQKIIIIIYGI